VAIPSCSTGRWTDLTIFPASRENTGNFVYFALKWLAARPVDISLGSPLRGRFQLGMRSWPYSTLGGIGRLLGLSISRLRRRQSTLLFNNAGIGGGGSLIAMLT